MKKIPQYEPLYGHEEEKALVSYLRSNGWLTEFNKTQELEQGICKFTKAHYASAVTSGSVALFIALKACGIKPGDEVIVPNITMVATPCAVVLAGAKPIFVDINENNLCLDFNKTKKAINKKTKAVIHVDLNGRSGDIDKIRNLCLKKKIPLVEDAAQAFGSFRRKKHLGTIGTIGIFSLSFHKIITSGQGGLVVTNDKKLYERVEKIKDYGRLEGGKDYHPEMGYNFKFTDIQAVFGIEQLKKIKVRMKRKREIYNLYVKSLNPVKQIRFPKINLKEETPWFVDAFTAQSKELEKYLKSKNIGTRPLYPPLHTQPIFKHARGSFINSVKMAGEGLWLPSSLKLSDNDIKYICRQITNFFKSFEK